MKIKVFQKNEKIGLLAAAILLVVTLFFDDALLRHGVGLRFSWLDGLMLFMTDFGLIYFFVVLIIFLLFKKKIAEMTIFLLSVATSFELSYLLKMFFQTPRPYIAIEVVTIPLIQAAGFSFPSLHTVICISLLPFLNRIFTKTSQKVFATLVVGTIALSRPYLGVHYVSDVIAGAIIGYTISKIWIYVEERYHFTSWFLFHTKDKFELRRQIAHMVTGLIIVFLLKLKLLNAQIFIFVLIIGGILSFLSKSRHIPFVSRFLKYFERPHDLGVFPGKGSFFLVLGCFLSTLLFPENIALAAITIMAIGDSLTTIIGQYFGKIKNPLSSHKHLEGTIIAIFFATLGAFFFVDLKLAFMSSFLTLLFESVYPRKLNKYLDDNLFIPLVAGAIMMAI